MGRIFRKSFSHYENMSMQYTENFLVVKKKSKNSSDSFFNFLIFAQNIDCGLTLEPPC